MNIAFLGGVFPKHMDQTIFNNSKKGVQFAANNLQWKIIRGLDIQNENPIHLCNLVFIGSYPLRYKQLFFRKENFSHISGASDISYGFLNLSGIKYLSRTIMAIRGLVNWSMKDRLKGVVVVYSVHTPFLIAASLMKVFSPRVKVCIIVPDLPEFMSGSPKFVYRFFKRIDKVVIDFCLKSMDGFVVLSENMVTPLKINGRPWICMEGIGNDSIPECDCERCSTKEKVILYTGTLAHRYGIINLLNAFQRIGNPDYRLWICGEGDAKEIIAERASEDERIIYYGKLPLDEVLSLQRIATVLVNPRTSEGEYTKYSFPSKIMEYLSSGTPTISHRLPGIPNEYFKYCFVEETETVPGLARLITSVCEMSEEERRDFGRKAQYFILSEKNPTTQGKIIFQLLEKIIERKKD